MNRITLGIVPILPMFAATALVFCALTARADDQADWLKGRQTQFVAWRKAHPGAAAAVADFKSRTAQAMAAAGTPGSDITAPPVIWGKTDAPVEFWDEAAASPMIAIPPGNYTMGSPETEALRASDEGPQHRVTIDHAFALGKYAVTRDEYAAFVAETGQADKPGCLEFDPDTQMAANKPDATWRNPGFSQTGSDPAVCVNRDEALAYIAWLSKKTGKPYRLPTEEEWEFAARAGTTTPRSWGTAPGHDNANFGIEFDTWPPHGHQASPPQTRDVFPWTSPVGSFPPNPFGLYDMIGNSFEWTSSCYHTSYAPPPDAPCTLYAERGGDWVHSSRWNRSAFRGKAPSNAHINTDGFRLALTL